MDSREVTATVRAVPASAPLQRNTAMKPSSKPWVRHSALLGAALLTQALAQHAAHAQAPGAALPELRTTFQLQGFLPRTTSTARVDDWYLNGPGSTASGESDYGLPRNRPTFGLAFMRRIGENWRFDLEYQDQRRSADQVTLRRDMQGYGGTYAAGTSVNARMDFTSLRVAGGYTLRLQDTTALGVSFGGIVVKYQLDVQGPTAVMRQAEISDVLPSLGVFASSALSPSWRLQGRFEAGPGNRQLNVGASWRFAAQASLGVNLRWMDVKVTQKLGAFVPNNDFAEIKLLGPQVMLEVGF
jgi:hypothetical protein